MARELRIRGIAFGSRFVYQCLDCGEAVTYRPAGPNDAGVPVFAASCTRCMTSGRWELPVWLSFLTTPKDAGVDWKKPAPAK